MKEWLQLAFSGPVRRRAVRIMLVVGAILITINHGDAILRGEVDGARFARILLTLAVPYVVSTVSSVAAMREMRNKDGA
ncbi:MAG TPA: nitrate/nitrite transporter NrtS [Thermoanaerobaculia bacterium]|nr:nitrate/nitrite transporter NrtS [Thermoanaerobaculia bacterium]